MEPGDFCKLFPTDHIELLCSKYDDESGKADFLGRLLDRCLAGTPMEKSREMIWESLWKREESMSTGVGLGIAIPHCSSNAVTKISTRIAVLKEGINFQSIDEEAVRIVVLLLFPQKKFERHVKILSLISRILNDKKTRTKILKAASPAQIYDAMACAVSR